MNRVLSEKAASWAPAVLLAFSAAAGGLRREPAWLAFGALLAAWFALRRPRLSLAGQWAPLLFFCWLAAAALFSPDPSVSVPAAARSALLGLFFFWALSCEEGAGRWLAALYALGGACAGAFVAQRLLGFQPGGFIGPNPNYAAAFCAAAFPAAAAALAGAAEKRRKYAFAALALLLAAGIYCSGSRGAALAAFLAAAAGLAALRRWAWLGALFAAALATAALLPGEALGGLLKLHDPRAFERPRLWGAALEAALAEPLLGWGPGRFAEAFETFKFPYFDGVAYYGHSTLHAHSEPLNLAAEAGFPAAVLFLAAALAALRRGWREGLPLKLAALAVLLQACADTVFYSGAVGLLFWGSLGFSASAGHRGGGGAARPLSLLCLAGLLAGTYGGAGAFRASAAAAARRGANPALTLAAANAAAQRNPRNAFAAADLAAALAAAGDAAGAEKEFGRALELEPAFAAARLGLAGLYASSGRAAAGCSALAWLDDYEPPQPRDGYQALLLALDRPAAARFKATICRKKKIGNVTASPRRPR